MQRAQVKLNEPFELYLASPLLHVSLSCMSCNILSLEEGLHLISRC
jgi:hypothetical protein